jgi:PCRF domain
MLPAGLSFPERTYLAYRLRSGRCTAERRPFRDDAGGPNRQPNKPMQIDLQGIDFEKLKARIGTLKADAGYSDFQKRIEGLQRESTRKNFWNDRNRVREVMAELKALELKVQPIEEIIRRVTLLEEEFESLKSLSGDADRATLVTFVNDYREQYESVIKELETAEKKSLFTGEFDHSDAILTVRAESSNPGPCAFAFRLYKCTNTGLGHAVLPVNSSRTTLQTGKKTAASTWRRCGLLASTHMVTYRLKVVSIDSTEFTLGCHVSLLHRL